MAAAEQHQHRSLRQLKLKTVIKESHCTPVHQLDFNAADAACRNLFATVGKDQATIYDDMHMGDNVAVVGNLSLSNTLEGAKDALHACCWVKTETLSRHPYGDALLAVGGSDPCVHIISLVEAAVVGQLQIPAGTSVAELSAATECPGLLLVLYRDGSMQLWQVSSGACLWSCKTDAFAATLHPSGSCVLSVGRTGFKLTQWSLQGLDTSAAAAGASLAAAAGSAGAAAGAAAAVTKHAWLTGESSDSGMDSIRFLTGGLVATKTPDGYMAVYSWPAGKCVSSWKVPGCGSSSTPSYSRRCFFGGTPDGRFIAVGNNNATAYVYDTSTGRQVTRVEAIRVQGAVHACGLSADCRHLIMVAGHGYVFRFEARAPVEVLEAAADEEEEEQVVAAAEEEQDGLQDEEEPSLSDSDTDMPDAADADAEQQQQQPLSDAAQLQQQQQRTPTPPGGAYAAPPASLAGIIALPAAAAAATAAAAPASSGGSLDDALMGGVDYIPLGAEELMQTRASGRTSARVVSDSPLVFRPTPRRQ